MAETTPSGAQATKFPAGEEKAQQDSQPGKEHQMQVKPETVPKHYKPSGKLEGKVALITGGDSGIGRAVAALFAMEGADVGITYVAGDEDKDAEDTVKLVGEVSQGKRKATKYAADLGFDENCKKVIDDFLKDHKRIDILVNHAGEQTACENFEDLAPETVERTFRTNVFSQFFLTRYALAHMAEGSAIINTASVNAYKGNKTLIDYTASKGANVAFTRALALQLAPRNIRVNGVAPGPVWTPLITATFPEKKVASFGEETPLGRAGHPSEIAPAYVFLASADSSYITGQVIHPNGGMVVNA
jgi:NAD(P)-dependent dehydrogenase (short-subunit alcohol dehydrogenase family)